MKLWIIHYIIMKIFKKKNYMLYSYFYNLLEKKEKNFLIDLKD